MRKKKKEGKRKKVQDAVSYDSLAGKLGGGRKP